MALQTIGDASKFSLASLTPTTWQRRLTLTIVVLLLVASTVAAPFGAIQLPAVDGFIPASEAVIAIIDLLTAALLASHATTIGSRGLLLLAAGFLFEALIVIPHGLTFPGAFASAGLLGGGLQTTAWLFIFWHFGLPAAIIGYVYLPDEPHPVTGSTVFWTAALVVGLAAVLAWTAVSHGDTLPALIVDRRGFAPLANQVTGFDFLLSVVALLVVLRRRRKSVFDLWLTVAAVALVAELAMTTFVIASRFSVGFYTSRLLSLAASTVVLIALLAETVQQGMRLARTNLALQLERSRKVATLDAALAAMAHEVKQPLTSIISNAEAAQLMLDHAAPDLEEIRGIVGEIIDGSYRTDEIVKNVRSLFRNSREDVQQVDMNMVVKGILHGLQNDLADHRVTSRVELEGELPTILGHKGQLQELIVNLIHNALDAMKSGSTVGGSLYVRTERRGSTAVAVCVQDTGPGIAPEQMDRIFDPFVTTKKDGMGMGLAICRMIVERHGGELSMSPDVDIGARFEIVLPLEPPTDPDQPSPEQAVVVVTPTQPFSNPADEPATRPLLVPEGAIRGSFPADKVIANAMTSPLF
ncbi:MAG TPA: MASE4 domain-containing protein [Pseudolabrys sp.]|nr:MASE4 domain-containing protein [Pseudolabrys sp.]